MSLYVNVRMQRLREKYSIDLHKHQYKDHYILQINYLNIYNHHSIESLYLSVPFLSAKVSEKVSAISDLIRSKSTLLIRHKVRELFILKQRTIKVSITNIYHGT